METLEERVRRVVQEDVALAPYNPNWPLLFQEEKEHLLTCLPHDLSAESSTLEAPPFLAWLRSPSSICW